MKSKTNLLGIIAFIAIIGVSLTACGEEENELTGTTWKSVDSGVDDGFSYSYTWILKFTSATNYTLTLDGELNDSGPYTISGNKVTFIMDDDRVTGVISGNTISVKDGSYTYVFTKQ